MLSQQRANVHAPGYTHAVPSRHHRVQCSQSPLTRDDTVCMPQVNVNGENISLVTNRGLSYGEEYYGTFFRSLYTLFQVLTGESWSEVVARTTIFSDAISIPAPRA